jgi:catechol 2,3-dioxygenase-like lactoylglutathione lyase family enzyme
VEDRKALSLANAKAKLSEIVRSADLERTPMIQRMKKSSITDNFHHVGIIVKDVDKAVNFYESLGIGPFESLTITARDRKLRGKPLSGLKLKIRIAHVGQTRIEAIQPVEGAGPWFEFLERHGEGIAHMAFVVDDIEKAKFELVTRGLKILYESWFEDGGAAAYLESDQVGGTVLEIFQRPPNYVPRKR